MIVRGGRARRCDAWPATLSDRPDRRAVARAGAAGPVRAAGGRPREVDMREVLQRHLLPRARRGLLADVAARSAAVGDGPLLLSALARDGRLGAHARRPARESAPPGGARGDPERSDPRQPDREDDGKRGPRGYDAGKKIAGRKRHLARGHAAAWCSRWSSTRRQFQDRDGAKLVLAKLLGRLPRLPSSGRMAATPANSSPGSRRPTAGRSRSSSAAMTPAASRSCRSAGLSSAPSPGRRLPPPEQGRRGDDREWRGLGHHCHDRPHGTEAGTQLTLRTHPLKGRGDLLVGGRLRAARGRFRGTTVASGGRIVRRGVQLNARSSGPRRRQHRPGVGGVPSRAFS